jgi:hypothetical protein
MLETKHFEVENGNSSEWSMSFFNIIIFDFNVVSINNTKLVLNVVSQLSKFKLLNDIPYVVSQTKNISQPFSKTYETINNLKLCEFNSCNNLKNGLFIRGDSEQSCSVSIFCSYLVDPMILNSRHKMTPSCSYLTELTRKLPNIHQMQLISLTNLLIFSFLYLHLKHYYYYVNCNYFLNFLSFI